MAAPRIANRPPNACAGCYGQYPERLHVDFKTAIEGGPVESEHAKALRVDWVVLCESCIRTAIALLPDSVDLKAQHEAEVAQLRERCEQAENYASTLEDTMSRRPDSLPPREREPRPKAAKPQRERKPNSRDLAAFTQEATQAPSKVVTTTKPKAAAKQRGPGKRAQNSRYAGKTA